MIDVHYASLTSQGVQHRVFYRDGHPSTYQPRPTGLNFGEQTGTGVFPLVIAVPPMNLSGTAASIVRTICAGFAIQSFTRLSVKHCGMFLWTIGEFARFPLRAVRYNMVVGQTSKTKTIN